MKKTTEKLETLRSLWGSDMSVELLAERLGVTGATVQLWGKQLGLPSRRERQGELVRAACARRAVPTPLDEPRLKAMGTADPYMTAQALRRGLSVAELERRILVLVAKDRIVDAVLDDELVA